MTWEKSYRHQNSAVSSLSGYVKILDRCLVSHVPPLNHLAPEFYI